MVGTIPQNTIPIYPELSTQIPLENDLLYRIYNSSLVYWLIGLVILGILYMSIIIYLKILMGDKWKDGIVKWMLGWYLDKTQKQIQLTKDSELFTPIFEKIKENIGV
jgi:hypothetical protein